MKKIKLMIVMLLCSILCFSTVCYAKEDEDDDYSGVTYEEVEDDSKKQESTTVAPATTEAPKVLTTEAATVQTTEAKTEVTTEAVTEATTESAGETDKVLEEVDENGQPFSTSGNSSLVDDYQDDKTKEFLTITTDNGNSYFIVIDRSGNMDNVYLLSKVDEHDLQNFVEKEEEVTTEEPPKIVLPEEKEEVEEKDESKKETNKKSNPAMIFIVVAALGGIIYYFKSKSGKPKGPAPINENLEDEYEEPDDVEITYQDDPFDNDDEDEETEE